MSLLQNARHQKPYPVSRGYIFALWAVVGKVAFADNHSIFYYACVKFVTWFTSKINRQVCHQMTRNSFKKILQQELWSATQDKCKTHAMLLTGQEQEKPVCLIYSSRFLDRFEQLSAEATFRTPAHTVKL